MIQFKNLFYIVIFLSITTCIQNNDTYYTKNNVFEEKIIGSLLASAIGDAFGRVTEFIPTTNAILEQYPHGLTSYSSFLPSDWQTLPDKYKKNHIVPYTDDTRMTVLVLKALIRSKKEKLSLDKTMSLIAKYFIQDSIKPYGWAATFRVPGNTVLQAVKKLKLKKQSINLEKNISIQSNSPILYDIKKNNSWWQAGDSQAGGCGSVMHALPFGLIFSDNFDKGVLWAAEHSKITHSNPKAIAACAAMAAGIITILNKADAQAVVNAMINSAKKYDNNTANKIEDAINLAKEAYQKLIPFNFNIHLALENKEFRAFHEKVFQKYQGWAADDAIAAAAYVFMLYPNDAGNGIMCAVHTPGDSDSIACLAGGLIGARVGIYGLSRGWTVTSTIHGHILEDNEKLRKLAKKVAQITKL